MQEIVSLIRPDLVKLKPYSSARDEFQGNAEVYIDANENPFDNKINRYPDPLQRALKAKISEIKGVESSKIFLGNGSDEVLDLIFRLFCIPGEDEIIITPPTYGMYKVLAGINNIHLTEVILDKEFQLNVDSILKHYNRKTKLLFLCSPNNPVGNLLVRADVIKLLDTFPGIIVIDEAYIDFSDEVGYKELIADYPRLIVTQTFSKAWGMAGLRLGMAFANEFIVSQLNKIKPPYNINVLTQKKALEVLEKRDEFLANLSILKEEKSKLHAALKGLKIVRKVHESAANFLLTEVDNADEIYDYLVSLGIVVRNRSNQVSCENCLRFSVGLPEENIKLIKALSLFN